MGNVTKTFKYQPAYAGLSMKNKFNSCCKDKIYFRNLQTFLQKNLLNISATFCNKAALSSPA